MADTSTPSALPSAARARLAALEAAAGVNNNQPTEPTTPVGQVTTPNAGQTPSAPATPQTPSEPQTPNAATVTMSREEYNELQATAGKSKKALADLENARLAQEDMAHRLTELEKASKSTPAPAPAPAQPEEPITFTAEEEREFGDSKEFIAKVVKQQLAPHIANLNKLIEAIKGDVETVKTTATQATTTVAQRAEREFFSQVKSAVTNLEDIKRHKNWPDFLQEVNALTGATYETLLAHNIKKENLDGVTAIYKAFSSKYLQPSAATSAVEAGYAGGMPSGGATNPPTTPQTPVKLKQSDRKRASEDYRKGRITWDQLQEINNKFEEADKNGNIDYDN